MLFNSYIFIFLFFPVCLLGYYFLKNRNADAAKIWLVGFSLWFYGYFNIRYLCIMLFSIAFNYAVYRLMMRLASASEKARDLSERDGFSVNNKKKYVLITGVGVNLLLLFYFKYFDFFIENINGIFGSSMALMKIVLPLGISFFTFQQISFLADAYRGELKNCSLLDYALFVSFFPQLIAGPIVTHDEMLPQFEQIGKKKFDEENFCKGLFVFVLGMGKKVLIADTFGVAVDAGYGMLSSLSSVDALLVMLFYTLQLYYDFSGYCDMAIGIGRMLGMEIALNFYSPSKAGNIIDFWKRWHITLSRFFTKNIYIPLGGNRKGAVRMYVNLFLVFFLSGLWHGAGWNYILWGVMHGVLYCITRWLQLRRRKKQNRDERTDAEIAEGKGFVNKAWTVWIYAWKVLATFLYVNVAWVFFRSPSISQAFELFKRMFIGGFALPTEGIYSAFQLDEFWYVLKILRLTDFPFSNYMLMVGFTLVILVVTFFGKNVHELAVKWKMSFISAGVLALVFIWCVVSLSGVSTFLYFNF